MHKQSPPVDGGLPPGRSWQRSTKGRRNSPTNPRRGSSLALLPRRLIRGIINGNQERKRRGITQAPNMGRRKRVGRAIIFVCSRPSRKRLIDPSPPLRPGPLHLFSLLKPVISNNPVWPPVPALLLARYTLATTREKLAKTGLNATHDKPCLNPTEEEVVRIVKAGEKHVI